MQNFKRLINQANTKLQKVSDFLIQNEEAFYPTDLKLYDIYSDSTLEEKYNLTDTGYWSLFNDFCEDSYDAYKDWRDQMGLTNEHNYLRGSSSTFFLDSQLGYVEVVRVCGQNTLDIPMTIQNIVAEHCDSRTEIKYILQKDGLANYNKLEDFLKTTDERWLESTIESLKDDLEWIASSDMLGILTDNTKNIVADYNYIKSFKENQLTYFNDYIEFFAQEYPELMQNYTFKEV